jgi:N-acyl-D-aspartate/D-glutamate deacylase
MAEHYDLLIGGGTLIDGTGSPARTADLILRTLENVEGMSLEAAVELLTSRSAEVFGITDLGRLEVGLAADITIFDPHTVACGPLKRVWDLPAGADRLVTDAEGVRAVVVNGQLLREDGHDQLPADGPLPGRLLRGGHA